MEVTKANKWAADLARYLRDHEPKRATALRARIKAITHGEGLDDNDLDQLERKVRRIIFGQAPHDLAIGAQARHQSGKASTEARRSRATDRST